MRSWNHPGVNTPRLEIPRLAWLATGPDHHEAIGIVVRQGPQNDTTGDGKDGDVGAQAEREREREEDESRVLR